jgi:hypothetical protein
MTFSSGGVLSGTPTATASGSITFTATNAYGFADRALTLTVSAAGTSPNYVVALDDWSTGSAVQIGTLTLNVDNGIITPQDSTLAAHYSGGIQTWRSASSIIHGPAGEQFEFGAMMFAVANGAEDNTDLYQVLVGCKPYGRWSTYPFYDTFNPATDITHPAPFKIRILNGSGTLVTTLQMQDGLPINSSSLSQSRSSLNVADANYNTAADSVDGGPPLRPFFNCAMLLPWQNKRPKDVALNRKKLPKFDLSTYRESEGKSSYSSNACDSMLGLGQNAGNSGNFLNGHLHFHLSMDWPQTSGSTSGWTSLDSFCPPLTGVTYTGEGARRRPGIISGYKYEPGSISMHTWHTGPGGLRFDRWMLPTQFAYYNSNENWVRPRDNSQIKDHIDGFGFAYFNQSCHYLKDVKTFEPAIKTKDDIESKQFRDTYYGQNTGDDFNKISLRAMTQSGYNDGTIWPNFGYDKLGPSGGRRFWNGWNIDNQHTHQQPGIWTYALGSPMHLVANKNLTDAARMCSISQTLASVFYDGQMTPPSTSVKLWPTYGVGGLWRTIAFRLSAIMWQWLNSVNSSSSAFGYSRPLVDSLLVDEFAAFKTYIVDATNSNAPTSPWHMGVKNFGQPIECVLSDIDNLYYPTIINNPIGMYCGQLMIIMKQTGFWNYLRTNIPNASACLDFWFEIACKYSVDFIINAKHLESTLFYGANPFSSNRYPAINAGYAFPRIVATGRSSNTFVMADLPNSWTQAATAVPAQGSESWLRLPSGSYYERYGSCHLKYQFVHAARHWFTSADTASRPSDAVLDSAIAIYEAEYAAYQSYVNSKATALEKTSADFSSKHLPAHKMLTPAQVG